MRTWLDRGDVILRLERHEAEALVALFSAFPKGKPIETPLRKVLAVLDQGVKNTTEAQPLVERPED